MLGNTWALVIVGWVTLSGEIDNRWLFDYCSWSTGAYGRRQSFKCMVHRSLCTLKVKTELRNRLGANVVFQNKQHVSQLLAPDNNSLI